MTKMELSFLSTLGISLMFCKEKLKILPEIRHELQSWLKFVGQVTKSLAFIKCFLLPMFRPS